MKTPPRPPPPANLTLSQNTSVHNNSLNSRQSIGSVSSHGSFNVSFDCMLIYLILYYFLYYFFNLHDYKILVSFSQDFFFFTCLLFFYYIIYKEYIFIIKIFIHFILQKMFDGLFKIFKVWLNAFINSRKKTTWFIFRMFDWLSIYKKFECL